MGCQDPSPPKIKFSPFECITSEIEKREEKVSFGGLVDVIGNHLFTNKIGIALV
jgi:hypothetical protein